MGQYGRLSDLKFIPVSRHAEIHNRIAWIKKIFERNKNNCKLSGITVKQQRAEIESIYGLKVSDNVMSELLHGKRYRVGFTLIMVLRDYWNIRGIPFSLD